jgi:hypothetical protein
LLLAAAMRRVFGWVLLLQLGCVYEHGYRSSNPLDAMLAAGGAAVATVVAPTSAPTPTSPAAAPSRPAAGPSSPAGPAPKAVRSAPAPAPARVPRAIIEGYVIGENGWGVPHAVVKVTGEHEAPQLVRANRDGRFRVPPPLAAGRYTLRVLDGCWEGSGHVEVSDGLVATLAVNVRRQPCVAGGSLFIAPE